MCGCEATFVCSKCKGTPFDPDYVDVEPMDEAEFDLVIAQDTTPWSWGEQGWV